MRLIPASAEDGATDGEDACERAFIEAHAKVFGEAAEAIAKADDLHAVAAESGFADATNGGVQSGTISACRDDTNAFWHSGFVIGAASAIWMHVVMIDRGKSESQT